MSKPVYTAPDENCPDCEEIISTDCVVEEDAIPGLGLKSGKTVSQIFKRIATRIKGLTRDLKKAIFDVVPTFSQGIEIFTYKEDACDTDSVPMYIPLFLNGKECFEYDEDVTVTYTDVDSYFMFFNYTHCTPIFTSVDDTVQITAVSGFPLSAPIVVKQPGDSFFSISDADKTTLLNEINTLTGSTFTDIVTDTATSIAPDLGLGLVPDTGAGGAFLGNLTFDYDVLDAGLIVINSINETIYPRVVSGVGISTINIVNFSVDAVMGEMTFYDDLGVEITDQLEIDALIQLILDSEVRPICCPECNDLGATFTYSGADVDCGALNLATAGDTIEDILIKVCNRIDTIGTFFNIISPNTDTDVVNVTIAGNAGATNITGDVTFFVDRIGCNDDIVITIDSVDGITFNSASPIATIPADISLIANEFEHPVGLPAGSYNVTLTWSSCGLDKVQNITLNLS